MQVDDALTKIEAQLAAATPRPWEAVDTHSERDLHGWGCGWTIKFGDGSGHYGYLQRDAILISHAPTYLAALVEVAKAANNGLFECENMESDEPWYKWLRAALDALTKAVQGDAPK